MTIKRQPLDVEEVRGQLWSFEEQYGLPSDRLEEAFLHEGRLLETRDYLRWSFLYSVVTAGQEPPNPPLTPVE